MTYCSAPHVSMHYKCVIKERNVVQHKHTSAPSAGILLLLLILEFSTFLHTHNDPSAVGKCPVICIVFLFYVPCNKVRDPR
jgi:hypothetical protein